MKRFLRILRNGVLGLLAVPIVAFALLLIFANEPMPLMVLLVLAVGVWRWRRRSPLYGRGPLRPRPAPIHRQRSSHDRQARSTAHARRGKQTYGSAGAHQAFAHARFIEEEEEEAERQNTRARTGFVDELFEPEFRHAGPDPFCSFESMLEPDPFEDSKTGPDPGEEMGKWIRHDERW